MCGRAERQLGRKGKRERRLAPEHRKTADTDGSPRCSATDGGARAGCGTRTKNLNARRRGWCDARNEELPEHLKAVALTLEACASGHDLQIHGGHTFCIACGTYTSDPMWLRKLTDVCRKVPAHTSADQRRKRMIDGQYPMKRLGKQELQGKPIRLGDVGRRTAARSKAKPLITTPDDDVPLAPIDDVVQVCNRLGGPPQAERLWEALIKGLGRVLGLGDAPVVDPESDGAAEDGLRTFHRSGCCVCTPMGAIFLPLHRPGTVVTGKAAESLSDGEA